MTVELVSRSVRIVETLLDRDGEQRYVSLIDALGNGTRLAILRELSREPMYVSELVDAVGMDGKTAVHHLSTLEDAELVRHYRQGNRKYYELTRNVELRIAPPPERTFILQAEPLEEQPENR